MIHNILIKKLLTKKKKKKTMCVMVAWWVNLDHEGLTGFFHYK